MLSADGDVAFVAADLDLFSFSNRFSAAVDSQHHGCLASAVANGFDLVERIGPSHQMLATLKQIPLKIGSETIG